MTQKRKIMLLKYFWIAAIFITACSDSGTRPDELEFVLPESDLHYIEDIQDMFIAKCGFESGCHSAADIDNGLMYVHLTNRNALINYSLSANSVKLVNLNIHRQNPQLAPLYLILKEGYPIVGDNKMPPPYLNRAPLNDNQLKGILQWIREGAPE
jgi:hypothetical protein